MISINFKFLGECINLGGVLRKCLWYRIFKNNIRNINLELNKSKKHKILSKNLIKPKILRQF